MVSGTFAILMIFIRSNACLMNFIDIVLMPISID